METLEPHKTWWKHRFHRIIPLISNTWTCAKIVKCKFGRKPPTCRLLGPFMDLLETWPIETKICHPKTTIPCKPEEVFNLALIIHIDPSRPHKEKLGLTASIFPFKIVNWIIKRNSFLNYKVKYQFLLAEVLHNRNCQTNKNLNKSSLTFGIIGSNKIKPLWIRINVLFLSKMFWNNILRK